jgi:hypothetical protein
MSAESQMAAFYKPVGRQVGINTWQFFQINFNSVFTALRLHI